MDTLEFSYRPRIRSTLAGVGLFGGAMVLFGHAAMTGAALGIRPLGPLDGPFGYWILFILSAGMTVGSIYAAYLSQTAAVPYC